MKKLPKIEAKPTSNGIPAATKLPKTISSKMVVSGMAMASDLAKSELICPVIAWLTTDDPPR